MRLGNIGRDKVYNLLNSGQIEAKKIGRRTFVTNESIEKYIQNLPPFPQRSKGSGSQSERIKTPEKWKRAQARKANGGV